MVIVTAIMSLGSGYLVGCINPAMLIARAIIYNTHLSNFRMARKREDVVNTTDFVKKVFGREKESWHNNS